MRAQVLQDSTLSLPDSLPSIGQDTLPAMPDSLAGFPADLIGDSTGAFLLGDSVAIDPFAALKDSLKATSDLKAKVEYKAADSIVFDVKTGMLYLYEEADLTYDDIQLKSKRVRIAMDEQTLYANGVEDENGKIRGKPQFTQGGETYQAEQLPTTSNLKKAEFETGG